MQSNCEHVDRYTFKRKVSGVMKENQNNGSRLNGESRRKYWQSLEERTAPPVPTWLLPEFHDTPAEELEKDTKNSGVSRKSFLKFMGAAGVMAGAACRRPTEQIVPAVIQSPEYVPGQAEFYSSTAPDGTGIVIRSREGRPIKIAGNPEHPLTRGGVSAYNIASIADLYDPDRCKFPVKLEKGKPKKADEAELVSDISSRLSDGNYVLLTGPVESPSASALVKDFMNRYPGGKHVQYRQDPTVRQIVDGQKAAYGQAVFPNYRFEKAEYILSIEADFLGAMPGSTYFAAGYGKMRDIRRDGKKINRLVSFESMFSMTGSNADNRYPIRPGDGAAVAMAIASALVLEQGRGGADADTKATLEKFSPAAVSKITGIEASVFSEIARELWKSRGKGIVIAGSASAANGNTALQSAVNLLNTTLENDGKTIDYAHPMSFAPGASDAEIAKLVSDMAAGKVKTLIVADMNPVYHFPASLNVADALSKVEMVVSLNDRVDETGAVSSAVLPASHFLESWGDSELVSGILSVRQPAIRPLYNTKSFEERLIQLAGGSLGGASTYHDYIQGRWSSLSGGSFRTFWNSVLRNGFYAPGKSAALGGNSPSRSFSGSGMKGATKPAAGMKLGMYYNVQVMDGTGANNAYRQELPEPVSKIVWENFASVLPATARKLGIKQGSIITLDTENGKVTLPVHLLPGIHADAIMVALGYGRQKAGNIGTGRGQSLTHLVTMGKKSLVYGGVKINEVINTGKRHKLSTTQTTYRYNHNTENRAFFAPGSMPDAPYGGSSQYDRPIILETTLKEFKKDPTHFFPEKLEYPSKDIAATMPDWVYDGLRWHMAIDLNTCVGCGACVTSCNMENNIPMVGPEQVYMGREMHWLKIDRYFSGSEENPDVAHQPMMCQHCENAPCENVCPVNATQHTSEGLNVMAYNRCIGTRYCANNCPYKVRRFNWHENWYQLEGALVNNVKSPSHLGFNPDVAVRSRGVIEKCSFCIHRINQARSEMRARGDERIPDGKLVTACQEVCPTSAITFGDINDEKSRVFQIVKNDSRGYKVLDFLEVRPSITYLAKIRNKEASMAMNAKPEHHEAPAGEHHGEEHHS